MAISILSECPICLDSLTFEAEDDFWSCRDGLVSAKCPFGKCVTRERAVARALFSLYERKDVFQLRIHEAAPAGRGLSSYLAKNCMDYTQSGYFPDLPMGSFQGGLCNQNLEKQTFDSQSFDIVLHLDVLEHLFNPFAALNEIYRTLRPGGCCIFTAPTEHSLIESRQVASIDQTGLVSYTCPPKYHGNPQTPGEGSLVTWEYGYNLPLLIQRHTPFDVEVRRYQSRISAVMGYMNEVYICYKG
jgi:SAM-dependent methyltransferase